MSVSELENDIPVVTDTQTAEVVAASEPAVEDAVSNNVEETTSSEKDLADQTTTTASTTASTSTSTSTSASASSTSTSASVSASATTSTSATTAAASTPTSSVSAASAASAAPASSTPATSTNEPAAVVPPPSINDEEAFPALGSGLSGPSTPVSWGPSMSTPASSVPSGSKSKPSAPVIRSKNVQEAFNISNVVSLNISKIEFAKIVNDLKKTYSVSIESTLSSVTKQRSFIVTGKPNDVLKTRKELVRRLTKPISIRLKVPSKTRSAIIGAGGKNLKPIIESTSTKINIDKSTTSSQSDDEEDELIDVTIEGDVDGVEEAKQSILKIVNEETKHLTTKILVPKKLAPFVKNKFDLEIENLVITSASDIITLSGLRDVVLLKKSEINASLEQIDMGLKTDVKTIPKRLHQFINVGEILDKFEVVVQIPDFESSDEIVVFVGKPANISKAISFARSETSKFTSESLDISKAHGNNVNHARALAAYFQYTGILKRIGSEFKTTLIAPSYSKLASKDLTNVIIQVSGSSADLNAIKFSRKALIQHVNNLPPTRVKVITDINPIFAKKVVKATEGSAKLSNVTVVPLNDLTNGQTNEVILIAAEQEEDDFAPAAEALSSMLDTVNDSLNEIRKLQENLKTSILDVPADKQQFIEGPNGTTLKNILNSFENSVLVVKLHHNGETESEDNVFIHGFKQDVSKVEKEIQVLLKDAADLKDIYSFEATTQVPTTILPRLIGKNGANLNQLRDQYKVEVEVEKNPQGDKASLTITGYKFNVKEVEQLILQNSRKWADEISKNLIVPKKYRSSLIGSNGQHVKKLQNKYNVKINFSSNSDEVNIRGPSRGVNKAAAELKDLLDFEIENGYTKEIVIPQSTVSRIIGRQGETINRIAVDSGIDIKVQQDDDKDSTTRTILLTGSRKGLNEAEKQINALVKELQDIVTIELEVDSKYFKDILGPRGSKKQEIIEKAGGSDDKDYRRLLQIPEQGSDSNKIVMSGSKKIVDSIVKQVKKLVEEKENMISESIEIAKEKHRLLIGARGSARRALEEEFNIQLMIPKIDNESTTVKIIGSSENVEKAKAKVNEMVADNWKAVVNVPASLHFAVSEREALPRRLRVQYNVEVEHGDDHKRANQLVSTYPSVPAEAFGDAEKESLKFTVGETKELSTESTDSIQWRLKGEDEQVAEAEKLIKELIEKYSKDDTFGFFWVKDPSVFGKVVGPQGTRLSKLRKSSNCQIYVPRMNEEIKNIIYLKGDKQALVKAEKLLRSEIEKK